MRRYLPWTIILLTLGVAFWSYPQLPEQVASHWNIQGEADGYMSRFWGAFFLPLLLTGLFIILKFIPRLDPRRANIEKFQAYYENFINIMVIFMAYIFLLTIGWNLGYRFNFGQVLTPAFSGMFYYLANLMEHSRPNWFIGIRTPWTLSNDLVWEQTHQLGGRILRMLSIILLIGIILPNLAFYLLLFGIFSWAIGLYIYSYLIYRRLEQKV